MGGGKVNDNPSKKESKSGNDKKGDELERDGLESMKKEFVRVVSELKERINNNENKIENLETKCSDLNTELENAKRELDKLNGAQEKSLVVEDNNNNGKQKTDLNGSITEVYVGQVESPKERVKPDAMGEKEWIWEKRKRAARRRNIKIAGMGAGECRWENIV